ncbi:MAG TPA: winged helix-turn-helix domain-containing protein, partial [Bryobacteraceae bacterium]|nr:winged helix-turn-helix domain-containing protein [Bryobacteraceae bacterium]
MGSVSTEGRAIRFGVYEVDLAAGELRKRGRTVKLQGQPFQILAMLLRRPGEVVSREELQQALWPSGTFVEFEHGVNTAIRKIREALGDSAENPRFIETLPRKGYRFIAPVDGREIRESPRRGRAWVLALALCAALLGGLGVWSFMRTGTKPEAAPVPIPLTSFPGREGSPSFSPDGSQVAFAWQHEGQETRDICVKVIGLEETRCLTSGPADEHSPAWSPDGRYIAFIRDLGEEKGGIFLIPAIGGPERKVAEGRFPPWFRSRLAWHPGGRWLVTSIRRSASELSALFGISVESGDLLRLTSPIGWADEQGVVAPNGGAVAFSRCVEDQVCDIYVLEVSEDLRPKGEPRRITSFRDRVATAPAWTADSRAIVFTSGSRTNPSLWKVAVSGPGWKPGNPERMTFAGYSVWWPAVSRQGRLAYALFPKGVDIWRLELDASRPGTPSGGHGKPPLKLIPSTRVGHTPEYSPDGRRIAFGSDRSGNHEIWVANSDGSNVMQLTSFDGPYTAGPHWSPDGRSIAFASSAGGNGDVYIISLDGGKPKRLTTNASDDGPSAWSRDGKWICFYSDRTGEPQVWKVRAEGGGEVQVTRNG